jgi:4-diphosphocytidyl-2-C-methyl-D-erythritol kinase
VRVSTAWAYKNLQRKEIGQRIDLRRVLMEHLHTPDVLSRELTNDFEESVFLAHPEIKEVRDQMLELGAECALMSGSGASVFALTKLEATAKRLLDKLSGVGRICSSPPFFSPTQEDPKNAKDNL